ncbi:HTTM domain-containing protein [Dietzia sp. PP-33]|uniref:HTTM domain-containing protein n=1 Tax=Dietzia sp. PP-33 TaxID=2957500 RepID=UPI0029A9CE16|nr:HTTM domain-containing protein [Dietzia sp. PP-33]MDX2358724.1 HTTM domain-containing protein [Dietzia sp. PP-33]
MSVPQLLKIQLTIVYAFAALTKINETYLSGSELYSSMVQAAAWQAVFRDDPSPEFLMIVSAASIMVEAFLAVGLWFTRTRSIALVVGLCFHAGLVIAVTGGFDLFADLSIYGGLILALYLPFFQDELDPLVGGRTGSTTSVRDAASSPTSSV